MSKIPDVQDEDIFIQTNPLTNLIKGKKLRKKMYDLGVKVEISKVNFQEPFISGFNMIRPYLKFVFHCPSILAEETMNGLVDEISEVFWRKYDCGQQYIYARYEAKSDVINTMARLLNGERVRMPYDDYDELIRHTGNLPDELYDKFKGLASDDKTLGTIPVLEAYIQ